MWLNIFFFPLWKQELMGAFLCLCVLSLLGYVLPSTKAFLLFILKWKKMQLSNFKAVSTDEKTAAAYCAKKSFYSVRNPSAADFPVHLHRLSLRT